MGATKARLIASALLLALAALGLPSAAGTRARQARQEAGGSAARQEALHAYRALPLAFVRNAGQLDRRVRYSAQAGGARVYLTRSAVTLALPKGRRGLALRLAFLGASPQAKISGARRSTGRVNYLIGNDPARWQTNLPTYREVVYRGLWPGVELRVLGQGGQLKYEFRLAPGADPARIRLAYRGQGRLSLEQDGALRIETALGVLRDARPRSYQPIAGKRVAVRSSFVLGRGGAYGFDLGAYDRRYPLVIDPGLVYSTYLGGSKGDSGNAVAVDGAGNIYVTGYTSKARQDFPTTTGALDLSYNGGGPSYDFGGDAFVTKLNAAGSTLVYSTYLGGDSRDNGEGIAVDRAGNAYVTGVTESTDFPATASAFDASYNDRGPSFEPGGDAFVAKLNAAGSALVYSTYLGGRRHDGAAAAAVDGTGNTYVTGTTSSMNFPTTTGAFDTSYSDRSQEGDGFVTKLNATGSALVYSTYLGGDSRDEGEGITVDRTRSAYVTGSTGSNDFPTTAAAFDRTLNGRDDVFVTKLNAAGSALAYSTYLGGRSVSDRGGDIGGGIAVDGAGSAYVTGHTLSRDYPTTAGAFDRSYSGGGNRSHAFVTKLDATGSTLGYSTYLSGGADSSGDAIAVDAAARAYVTGTAEGPYFPVTPGALRSSNGDQVNGDAFVTKLNAAGSALAYSTYLGGSGDDRGHGIAVDGAGSTYVTGETDSLTGETETADFPTTARAFDRSYNGGEYGGDGFVTKLDLVAGSPPSSGSPRSSGSSIEYWKVIGPLLIAATLVAVAYLRGPRRHR